MIREIDLSGNDNEIDVAEASSDKEEMDTTDRKDSSVKIPSLFVRSDNSEKVWTNDELCVVKSPLTAYVPENGVDAALLSYIVHKHWYCAAKQPAYEPNPPTIHHNVLQLVDVIESHEEIF